MSTAWANFQNDYQQLQADGNKYNADVQAQQEQEASYATSLQNSILNISSGSSFQAVQQAYVMLLVLMSGGGTQMLSGQLGVQGDALQIQGDITACGNDLQQITQSTATGPTDVQHEATGLDDMLNSLTGSGGGTASYIQDALGGATGPTASSLSQQFRILRNTIYVGNDPYDPAPPPASPTAGGTCFFDLTGSGGNYLQSYGEMQQDMGSQGDTKFANEASQGMVNAFNTNTSTTQSANAASNEEITQESNTIKTVSSFLQDMASALQNTSKAAINNMSQG